MKKIKKIENIDKNYNSLNFKKHLLYGLFILSISAFELSACGKKDKENVIPSISIESSIIDDAQIVFENKYGNEIPRPLKNKISEDEVWSYVTLYKRDVREYTDGSIGYSEWECLGEYLVKNIKYLDSNIEYRYEYISSINICDVIKEKFGNSYSDIFYFNDGLISIDAIKFYDYSTRDYVDGEYTDWVSDNIFYISDKEYIGNDLIKFDEIPMLGERNVLSLMHK